MEALKSVENEVDKVLRLFSTCRDSCNNKIDQLIQTVEQAKKDIDRLSSDHSELNLQQSSLIRNICDNIQKSCAQITNSHRELHVPVTKIGKSIDKNFSADFGCFADPNLFRTAANKELLNHAIVQHFLRQGMTDIAEELIREANLSIDEKELVKFDEVDSILTSLRKKDAGPALKWAIKNREQLRELNSPLEFKIHRINIIELYKKGISKQRQIIDYARENLQHLDPVHNLDIQHLMGGIIYLKTGIERSPYKSFLDPINFDEIEEIFISNACALLKLSIRSPISVAIDAGCVALPALLNINQILSNQGVENIWHTRDELPVEIDLGRKLQFHSTFSCPILKQQSTESNPPMRLVCGHVISRDALHKLGSSSAGNKLKCPYCPMEQVLTDAKEIYF
uniref:Protein RMD5 A n=1 Tax=Aceria tosichella TaxID=561515 RepID=A0A6G1SEN6_9ACAR